ncbi:MAG: hypothetical protein ACREL7_10990 [Longimicrobiales bacterium]
MALASLVLLAACGYFNAMYNARQQIDQARRAAERGDNSNATRAYLDAIDRAASSYRSHPDGRWADDALLLIAQARWQLGEYPAARAAAEELLLRSADTDLRAAAHAYAGSAALLAGDPLASMHLDSAVAEGEGESLALALLSRARLRFQTAQADAWTDLERASAGDGEFASAARLEAVSRAIEGEDTVRMRGAFARVFDDRVAGRWTDSIAALLGSAAARAGPRFAWSVSAPVEDANWSGEQRDGVRLRRIEFLAASGDTAAAVDAALDLADRAAATTAAHARVAAARLSLHGAAAIADILDVRATLLPVIAEADARALVRTIAAVEVLLEGAGVGQPLALFAAAELARDGLGTPLFARSLFLAYADLVPDAVWAPKALLAAAALGAAGLEDDAASRFSDHSDNVYVRAILDRADPAAFASAEERLGRSLIALRQAAFADADRRDLRVARAISTLDSLRMAALADSMRIVCGEFLDSLAITGIRSDSVRAACVRSDTALVTRFMTIDTLLLRDTTSVVIDTTAAGRRIIRDTTSTAHRE